MTKLHRKLGIGEIRIRKKGNGFEARVTVNFEGMEPKRISKYGKTKELAKKRVEEEIISLYIISKTKKEKDVNNVIKESSLELKKFNIGKDDIVEEKVSNQIDEYSKFKNLALDWLNFKKKQVDITQRRHISPKTLKSYVVQLKSSLLKTFGEYDVKEITKEVFQDYIDKCPNSPKSIIDDYVVMKLCLDFAKEKGLISSNPIIDVILPSKKKANVEYLIEERQKVWLNHMEEDGREWCLLFATLLQTGMRPEEGCGLKWKYVNFEDEYIYVCNAFKQIEIYDDEFNVIGHKYEDSELKTEDSYRQIPMCKRLKNMLLKLKDKKIETYKQYKTKNIDEDYVFLNENGGPYVSERLTNKMPKFIKKYNLEHLTVYGFRHSFASICSENGIPEIILAKIMGHSDPKTTKQYYIHISLDKKKEELKRVFD